MTLNSFLPRTTMGWAVATLVAAGELTDAAIDKVVADLPKILQKYEKKKK